MTIALSALVELAVYYPDLFVPSLPSILPFLLSLLSPPAQHPPPVPLSPYPLTHWRVEEWTNLSNPVTELLLNLLEVRRAQLVAWEEGRAGRELLGLLIARQIVEFELLGDDCADWLQADDVGGMGKECGGLIVSQKKPTWIILILLSCLWIGCP